MKLILKGGRVINPAEHFDEVADVLIEDGKIAAVGKDLSAEGAEVYDAAGKAVTLTQTGSYLANVGKMSIA